MLKSRDLGAEGAPNTSLLRRSALAVATLGALGLAQPAQAETIEWAWFGPLPSFEVASFNNVYTELDQQSVGFVLEAEIHVQGSTGANKVRWWRFTPYLNVKFPGEAVKPLVDLGSYATSQTYDSPRPDSVQKVISTPIISNFVVADEMVSACNIMANKLRAQGMSDAEIFASDREVDLQFWGAMEADFNWTPGHHIIAGNLNLTLTTTKVICKATEDLSPVAPDITAATLDTATQQTSNVTGACVLNLNGTIASKEPNTQVKFRYVDDGGQQSDLRTVTTDDGGDVSFLHSYPLDLKEKTSGKIQMVGASHAFKSNWADYQVDCERPADELLSALPPQATSLILAAEGEAVHGNLVCPVRVTLIGKLEGRGTASGTAFLAADGQLNAQKAYSIEDGETFHIKGEYDLDWDSAGGSQQSLPFALYATNANGEQVSALTRSKEFVCRPVQTMGVAQGAAGGVTTGTEQPFPSQSAASGQFARQAAGAVVIMAPRGTITSGRIQLSGGKPNVKHVLRFYRKAGSGYQQVRSARLPKQMTGAAASFDLKALTGGRNWRLEVCPADRKDKKACETSDFGLPATAGTLKAPGAPAGNKIFVLPGAAN